MTRKVAELPLGYYNFDRYIDRARWLTYYEQLRIVLSSRPRKVLEIGVGPGIVRAVLRDRGIAVETVDVNKALNPDHLADMRELPQSVLQRSWDWVLVSRVLHHIPAREVGPALNGLASLDVENVLITVPREDLSLQVSMRRTAGTAHIGRLSISARLKRALRRHSIINTAPSGLWMIDGNNGPSSRSFDRLVSDHFDIARRYVLPDDPSHVFFVLRKHAL